MARISRSLALLAVAALGTGSYAQTLFANPGPANNGGSAGWATFFDLEATSSLPLLITHLTTASTAAAGATYNIEVFRRDGTALGGPVGTGPGSSSAGWTSLGTATATQGAVASGVSLPVAIPHILVPTTGITGVALQFTGAGPRYFGTGTPALGTYSDANLTLVTGQVRSVPFTTGGSLFSSRELVGSLTYQPVPEPATILALATGVGLLARRRRKTA